MPPPPSLATLLSQVLVAFTIETDNEAEHRMPHSTTRHGSTGGPWLVSLVMWANCLCHLPAEGLSIRELERRARTPTNLAGMERWGHITVAPDPLAPRGKAPRAEWLVRPTAAGLIAQKTWKPLVAEIEGRWKQRFVPALTALRESL